MKRFAQKYNENYDTNQTKEKSVSLLSISRFETMQRKYQPNHSIKQMTTDIDVRFKSMKMQSFKYYSLLACKLETISNHE